MELAGKTFNVNNLGMTSRLAPCEWKRVNVLSFPGNKEGATATELQEGADT